MKRGLILGGNFLQLSAIRRAKELGYYVICANSFVDCMGRDYCDEFHQIDTTSADEIMKVVVCSKADGLLSYASDVAALPAAIVCEKLNLPTNLSQSVEILTKKHLFCSFLRK